MEVFRFWFYRRRYWVEVYFDSSTPKKLDRKGRGLWGYYLACDPRGRRGKFGELHFVTRTGRIRDDVAVHELFHLLADWLKFRKVELNDSNEEKIALWMDEIFRNFYKEYKKLQ